MSKRITGHYDHGKVCACGLAWRHTGKHRTSDHVDLSLNTDGKEMAEFNERLEKKEFDAGLWAKKMRQEVIRKTLQSFFKWTIWIGILAVTTFAIKLHYEFQARDEACKATAFDQLKEVIIMVRNTQK